MLQNLHESPPAKELAILEENRLSEFDPTLKEFLRAHHMQEDRHSSLEAFLGSENTQRIITVIERFCNGNKGLAICEIGAGDGFLALALTKAGFTNIDIVEPSCGVITGTGFLRDLSAANKITIFNDLESWYSSSKRYDILITNACIHHFENPLFVISQIRLKAHLNTIWLAFSEFFAFDYCDTITQLLNHRHAMLYGLYEFPYSYHLYRKLFYYAGFRPLKIEPQLPYLQMVVGDKLWQYSAIQKLSQIIWKIICCTHMTWPIYNFFVFIVLHFARDKIRGADPFYMAYKAKHIGWVNVKPNIHFLQVRAIGSRLMKNMSASGMKKLIRLGKSR